MTQLTERGSSLSPHGHAAARRSQAVGAALLGGVLAAGLGLGALAVAVLLMWITSPFPDSGPGGALHIAADLWLLAHGADLERADTLSGVPAPIGLTPMLLAVLPVWLLYRAARHALEPPEEAAEGQDAPPARDPELTPRSVLGWVTLGYLMVGLAAVVYAATGPVHVVPLSALLHLPVVAVGAVAAGGWAAHERPFGALPEPLARALDHIPGGVWSALPRPLLIAALRAAVAATAVLLAGGALLAVGSLSWHVDAAHQSLSQLTQMWSGRIAVLLLALVLAPNTVLWGAAYGLGPGFTLGGESVAGPFGAAGYPVLPHFPLFAGLPQQGEGGPLTWSVLGLPLVAGVVAGCFVGRAATRSGDKAADGRWGGRETASAGALAAIGCGGAIALLTGLASGPLGSAALADFGPSWWLTGPAALGWTALAGVPTAFGLRWWRVRKLRPPDQGRAGDRAAGRAGGDGVVPDRGAVPGARAWERWRGGAGGRGRARGGADAAPGGGGGGADGLAAASTSAGASLSAGSGSVGWVSTESVSGESALPSPSPSPSASWWRRLMSQVIELPDAEGRPEADAAAAGEPTRSAATLVEPSDMSRSAHTPEAEPQLGAEPGRDSRRARRRGRASE
ncbi:cell division protein PerM [Streptomyces sp. H27-D2]|uniref:cell division protein PerM n=1 Tax=Streptomyces sp. H27-D2 TaxID=3046304 RepID=UPI002DBEC38A|nr:DUF6350 family protein [Streptomyces sp. H27-D2]MEC4015982.1 DUF6350 family protein [Streptomyces sp. H27-D2]